MTLEEFASRGQKAQLAANAAIIIAGATIASSDRPALTNPDLPPVYRTAATKKKYDPAKVKHRRQIARASRKRNRRAA